MPDLRYFIVMPVLNLPYFAVYNLRAFSPYEAHFLIYSFAYLAMGLVYWALGLWLATSYARHHSSGSPRISLAAADLQPALGITGAAFAGSRRGGQPEYLLTRQA